MNIESAVSSTLEMQQYLQKIALLKIRVAISGLHNCSYLVFQPSSFGINLEQ